MPEESSLRDLWDFSLALYARPGVETACLDLQDRRGLDVTILLLCLWRAGRGRGVVAAAEIEAMVAALTGWRHAVVEPLRAVRRAMKHDFVVRLSRRVPSVSEKRTTNLLNPWCDSNRGAPSVGITPLGAPRPEAETLRAGVKALEREAERLAQYILLSVSPFPHGGQGGDVAHAARESLAAYFAVAGFAPGALDKKSLTILVEACAGLHWGESA